MGGVGGTEAEREIIGSNMGPQIEMAKLPIFNGEAGKVGGFITAYRLYLRIKMRETTVEEQVQKVLSFMQEGSVDVWKENVLEDLKEGALEYKSVGKFLAAIKKEFGRGEEESVKVAELKKLEQGGKTMEEFVQEFRKVARESEYKECSLIEEFKRGMNATIRRRLMEVEHQPSSIEQWQKQTIALDRNWRESRRKEERLRG